MMLIEARPSSLKVESSAPSIRRRTAASLVNLLPGLPGPATSRLSLGITAIPPGP
jgi:hypothetical protein